MMSMISDDELIQDSIEDIHMNLSNQLSNEVVNYLNGIVNYENVIEFDKNRLMWSLYSQYVPTIEEYHDLINTCRFDQTMVLTLVEVLHFFSFHKIELNLTRIFDLINRSSNSELLWSFLTLRSTSTFLKELLIQVGNQSYLDIPKILRQLESLLDDPELVASLMSRGFPAEIDGFGMSISLLSFTLREEKEENFKIIKFQMSIAVKRGKDIIEEWKNIDKMKKKLKDINAVIDLLETKFVNDIGSHIFETFNNKPTHIVNNDVNLIRGDYIISDEGDVNIRTNSDIDTLVKYICLPIDHRYMKKYSNGSKDLYMNGIVDINSRRSLKIPRKYFPDFTLTDISDVTFN